jgi:methylated-DNA-[protein]-cysteine S-methyltransferase
MITYTSIPSPLGTLWIAAGPKGLVAVDFAHDEVAFSFSVEGRGLGAPIYTENGLGGITEQLVQYFTGTRTTFDVAVDLSGLSAFQRAVLEAVRAVPWGEVRSYRDIARTVGKPSAARAVGSAVATNPISLVIPCHRIIRSDGTPGEYARRTLGSRGVERKLRLLTIEGIEFGSKR